MSLDESNLLCGRLDFLHHSLPEFGLPCSIPRARFELQEGKPWAAGLPRGFVVENSKQPYDFSPRFRRTRVGDTIAHRARAGKIPLRKSLVNNCNHTGLWTVGLLEGTPGQDRNLQRRKIFRTDRDKENFINMG